MSKGGGMGGFAMAMVFAVCFGSVGVFAGWVMGSTLLRAWSAGSWTQVDAEVLRYEGADGLEYRYRVGEGEYTGRRLGVGALEDMEVDRAVDERISKAFAEKRPLRVLVDPGNPRSSVVDASIPWKLVLFMIPFALGFGGVGLGALWVGFRQLVPEPPEEVKKTIPTDAGSGFLAIAGFTFLWNAISIPIAALAVPEIVRDGEWLGLFVLIFPLVGLVMIWATIHSAASWIRRGGTKLHPQHLPPRLGSPFAGYITFPRGVAGGDSFKVRLACETAVANKGTETHWSKETTARVADVGGNKRLTFHFDVPDRVPGHDRDAVTKWRLELHEEGKTSAAYGFNFEMQPPFGVEHLPEEELEADSLADEDDEQPVRAGIPKGLEGLANAIGRERIQAKIDAMPAAQRAKFHAHFDQLPPGQKQLIDKVGKYAHHWPTIRKLIFWAIGLFVAIQVLGVVSVFLLAD